MADSPVLTDVKKIRDRARQHVEEGAVTAGYAADRGVVLALLNAAPERTVFIGDSRHDLECGRAAGVKTAAVLWGPFDRSHLADLSPDYWLEKPHDLTQLY